MAEGGLVGMLEDDGGGSWSVLYKSLLTASFISCVIHSVHDLIQNIKSISFVKQPWSQFKMGFDVTFLSFLHLLLDIHCT